MQLTTNIPIAKAGKQDLTLSNYLSHYKVFQDRQAGVNLVFDPDQNRYFYNAYCLEITLLKELFSVEYEFVEDALDTINADFGTWELKAFEETAKSGCSTCVAK